MLYINKSLTHFFCNYKIYDDNLINTNETIFLYEAENVGGIFHSVSLKCS